MNRVLLAVSAVAMLSGCGASYKIIKQAPADQLTGKTTLAVTSIDFSSAKVGGKTEAEYLDKQDDTGKKQWPEVKKAMDEEMLKALSANGTGLTFAAAEGSQGHALVVKPIAETVDTGWYRVMAAMPSWVKMKVQIATAEGTVLDEIELESRTGADITYASDERRLRRDAEMIGKGVAKYLLTRCPAAAPAPAK